VLKNEAAWAQTRAAGTVTAYRQGGLVTVTGPAGTVVPVTVPAGTVFGPSPAGVFGTAYGGEQSAHQTLDGGSLNLLYPPSATSAPAPQPAPAAPAVPVPANDLDGAERSVTTDAAQDSAPHELVVPEPTGPEGGR
jgi:hypothetical protein